MSDSEVIEEKYERPIVVRNTTDLQRLKLEKLMKHPDKAIIIPERPKERGMPVVPDFVRNVMGSSAGAGSGEFHVYRHLRRKEYARQKYMKEKGERERLEQQYHDKIEDNINKAKEKTAKKRAKRMKKKQKKKGNVKKAKLSEVKSESSEEEDSDEIEKEECKETKYDANEQAEKYSSDNEIGSCYGNKEGAKVESKQEEESNTVKQEPKEVESGKGNIKCVDSFEQKHENDNDAANKKKETSIARNAQIILDGESNTMEEHNYVEISCTKEQIHEK